MTIIRTNFAYLMSHEPCYLDLPSCLISFSQGGERQGDVMGDMQGDSDGKSIEGAEVGSNDQGTKRAGWRFLGPANQNAFHNLVPLDSI